MKEHCWNNRAPIADGYWARDGLVLHTDAETGETGAIYKMVWVEQRMSGKCGQPGAGFPPLPGCVGCTHLGV